MKPTTNDIKEDILSSHFRLKAEDFKRGRREKIAIAVLTGKAGTLMSNRDLVTDALSIADELIRQLEGG